MQDETLAFRSVVISRRGLTLKVYDVPADRLGTPPGYLFRLARDLGRGEGLTETGAELMLWPSDLIEPVRSALAEGRFIDMRTYKRDQKEARRVKREKDEADRLAGRVVSLSTKTPTT